jgi:hypothetical protein
MHVLMYMSGHEYVWGPGRSADDRVLSQEELLQLAKQNLLKTDIVATFPQFKQELVPQLTAHIDWVPANAAMHFDTLHNARDSSKNASTVSLASRALLKAWMKEEYVLFGLAKKLSAERTKAAGACLAHRKGRASNLSILRAVQAGVVHPA